MAWVKGTNVSNASWSDVSFCHMANAAVKHLQGSLCQARPSTLLRECQVNRLMLFVGCRTT